jgi:predicted branched-subunit amino acid permease
MFATTSAQRAAFATGFRATAPALVATSIWGLVTGVAMIKTGLTVGQALAMTFLVYAGTAQMAALPLVAVGAPVWVALAAATTVNLRFVIFSATLVRYLGHLPLGRRLVMGYLTGDIPLAILVSRYGSDAEARRSEAVWFLLGSNVAVWLSWQAFSVVGIALAGQIPGHWGLEFAAILALIAITVPMFQGRPAVAGCITAGVVAVVAYPLPLKLGLLAAVLAGVAVAMSADVLTERRA